MLIDRDSTAGVGFSQNINDQADAWQFRFIDTDIEHITTVAVRSTGPAHKPLVTRQSAFSGC